MSMFHRNLPADERATAPQAEVAVATAIRLSRTEITLRYPTPELALQALVSLERSLALDVIGARTTPSGFTDPVSGDVVRLAGHTLTIKNDTVVPKGDAYIPHDLCARQIVSVDVERGRYGFDKKAGTELGISDGAVRWLAKQRINGEDGMVILDGETKRAVEIWIPPSSISGRILELSMGSRDWEERYNSTRDVPASGAVVVNVTHSEHSTTSHESVAGRVLARNPEALIVQNNGLRKIDLHAFNNILDPGAKTPSRGTTDALTRSIKGILLDAIHPGRSGAIYLEIVTGKGSGTLASILRTSFLDLRAKHPDILGKFEIKTNDRNSGTTYISLNGVGLELMRDRVPNPWKHGAPRVPVRPYTAAEIGAFQTANPLGTPEYKPRPMTPWSAPPQPPAVTLSPDFLLNALTKGDRPTSAVEPSSSPAPFPVDAPMAGSTPAGRGSESLPADFLLRGLEALRDTPAPGPRPSFLDQDRSAIALNAIRRTFPSAEAEFLDPRHPPEGVLYSRERTTLQLRSIIDSLWRLEREYSLSQSEFPMVRISVPGFGGDPQNGTAQFNGSSWIVDLYSEGAPSSFGTMTVQVHYLDRALFGGSEGSFRSTVYIETDPRALGLNPNFRGEVTFPDFDLRRLV